MIAINSRYPSAPGRVLALLLILGCSACASIEVTGQTRPAISERDVQVYYWFPDCRYEEIAIIPTTFVSSDESEMAELEKAVSYLKQAAAEFGANGVIVRGFGLLPKGRGYMTQFVTGKAIHLDSPCPSVWTNTIIYPPVSYND